MAITIPLPLTPLPGLTLPPPPLLSLLSLPSSACDGWNCNHYTGCTQLRDSDHLYLLDDSFRQNGRCRPCGRMSVQAGSVSADPYLSCGMLSPCSHLLQVTKQVHDWKPATSSVQCWYEISLISWEYRYLMPTCFYAHLWMSIHLYGWRKWGRMGKVVEIGSCWLIVMGTVNEGREREQK